MQYLVGLFPQVVQKETMGVRKIRQPFDRKLCQKHWCRKLL